VVSEASETTLNTGELTLSRAVTFVNTTTRWAGTGGIPWVNKHDGNPALLRLVRDKPNQLIEGPTVQRSSLVASNCNPVADTLEVFEGNGASGALRSSYNCFGDAMVYVGGEAPLLTSALFEESFGRSRAFGLEFLAQPTTATAQASDRPARVDGSVRVSENVDNPQIAAQHTCDIRRSGLLNVTSCEQVEASVAVRQVGFSLLGLQQVTLSLSTDKRDGLPSVHGPDRDFGHRNLPAQNTIIIRNAACGAERALGFAVEFVGISNLGYDSHRKLGRQGKLIPHGVIAGFMDGPLTERLMFPCPSADPVAGSISLLQCFTESRCLSGGGEKFGLGYKFHCEHCTTSQV